jgi:hypothetical protein
MNSHTLKNCGAVVTGGPRAIGATALAVTDHPNCFIGGNIAIDGGWLLA